MEGHITIEPFKIQNERIVLQQQELTHKKAEIQSFLAAKKDTKDQLQVFKKEVECFTNLDIDDEQVLQRLINTIEVYEDGKIKIHYNLSPLSFLLIRYSSIDCILKNKLCYHLYMSHMQEYMNRLYFLCFISAFF